MCLIIKKPANFNFNDAWLKDFFSYNRDGFGIMYAEGGELIIDKKVPKNDKAFLKAMKKVEDKAAVIHLRMKTHGEINEANTHPYPVLNKDEHGIDLWMMHNGVLHVAASDTPEMSDTWHYIRDIIKPVLEVQPDMLHVPAFQELIAEHIGNNRLAFMDNLGNVTIINEDQGTEFQGCWLSNTYAWSASLRHMDVPVRPVSRYIGYPGGHLAAYEEDDWDAWDNSIYASHGVEGTKSKYRSITTGAELTKAKADAAIETLTGKDDWDYDDVIEPEEEFAEVSAEWLKTAGIYAMMEMAYEDPDSFVYAVSDLVDQFNDMEREYVRNVA